MCRRAARRASGSSRLWWSCRSGACPTATGGTPVATVAGKMPATPMLATGKMPVAPVRLAWTLALPQRARCIGFEKFLIQKLDKK